MKNNWRATSLSKIGTLERGKGLQKDDFTETDIPCIHYGQIFTYYGGFTDRTISYVSSATAKRCTAVHRGDIILAITSENIQDLCKSTVWLGSQEIVTGSHSGVFRHNQNPKFLGYYFQSEYFNRQKFKFAKGTKVIEINPDDILNRIKIKLPDLKTQQKIVQILDTWLETCRIINEQITCEETIRRRISQHISKDAFAPNKTKQPISLFLTERKTFQKKSEGLPHVSLTKNGIIPKGKRYDRDFLVKNNEEKKYKITRKGDICYNPANLKFNVICRNNLCDGIFSPIYVTFNVDHINPIYIEEILTSNEFVGRALRYEQGTVYERKAVSPEDLLRMEISIPNEKKQLKIAEMIVARREYIEKLKLLNKKYLQQYRYLLNHLINGDFDLSNIKLENEKEQI